jgi:phosphohistidine phosphatase
MKFILLMRHGQSDPDESLKDVDRPLARQGRLDARRVGGLLRRLGIKPDLAVSSSALRARQTAELAVGGHGYSGTILPDPRLYEAEAAGYLEVLRGLPARTERVLLVGHNPAVRQAAATLLGSDSGSLRFPPAALACLEAPADDWAALQPGSCVLQWLVTPELTAALR